MILHDWIDSTIGDSSFTSIFFFTLLCRSVRFSSTSCWGNKAIFLLGYNSGADVKRLRIRFFVLRRNLYKRERGIDFQARFMSVVLFSGSWCF